MLVVDTNVLFMALMPICNFISAAATGSSANGRDRMLGIRPGGYFNEFLRVTTHPQVMRRPWNAKAAR